MATGRLAAVVAIGVLALVAAPPAAPAADGPFGPLDAPQFQTSYSDEVLADSPVAYWRLGESGGSAMTDVTGANSGTYIGGHTLGEPGALPYDSDTAVTFDGTTGRASAPDSASLDRTGAVTVEAWVKRTKSASYQVIVGKPGNGQSRLENYSIWFNTSNRAQAYFGDGTTFVTTVSAVVDTNWHHIAATYDNAVARIYIDGVQSGSASSTVALTPNDLGLNIAREYYNPYYFGGTLDEVAIYPTALSAERLLAHHAKAAADAAAPVVTLTQPANGSSTGDATPSLSGVAGTAAGDAPAVTVHVYQGAGTSGALLHSLSATPGGGGSYAVDSPALEDGTYTARAEQADAAGNTGVSALSTFTVDTAGPSSTITSGPADPTSSTSASFEFSAEEGATFECQLDAGSFAACTSPATVSGLADGSHTFSVRATDTAGNAGTEASRSWSIDATGPSTDITSGPADPTGSTSASFDFTSEAGATFECKLDAGSYGACTSPQSHTGLSEGSHVFAVRATDTAGNAGPEATRSWSIDGSGPDTTITGGPANPTNSASATLEFSAEAGATFECKLDAGSYAACTSPTAYSGLADGEHTFSVRATDTSGNTGAVAIHSWSIDANGPDTTITGGPASLTNSTSASLTFSSEAGATFECKLDSGSYAACTSPTAYSGLTDGAHTFSVRATEAAGNTGAVATHSWSIDTVGPDTTIISGPADPTNSASASLGFSSEAGATYECKLDAGSYAACTSPKAYSGLAAGSHSFSVRATDTTGNTGAVATHGWAIDTTAPAVGITTPPTGSVTNDRTPDVGGTAGSAAGDGSAITVSVFAGSTATGSPVQTLAATRGAGGTYLITAALLPTGTYTARAAQSDSAGNTGLSATTTFTINATTSDTTAPVISLTAPANNSFTTDTTPTFSGVAGTSSGDSTTVRVRVYAGPTVLAPLVRTLTATRTSGGSYSVTASPALVDGTYTARAEQLDSGSNTGFSAARTFTVDTTAPVATITGGPADRTNSTSASIPFTSDPGVTFQCRIDGASYATCTSPRAYTGLSTGSHTFSVRATDAAGNVGTAATRTWTIDTTAPTTSITGGPTGSTNNTAASLTFTAEAGATFQCKLDAEAYAACTSPKAYTALAVGSHTFSVRATDVAGNTGTAATRTWTIDTTPPTATITGGPADPTNSTSASLTFTSEAGATFQCKLDAGSFAACTSPRAYTALAAGGHTFSVRATDAAGNVGLEATRTWTIDNTAPVLTITSPATGSRTNDTTPNLAGVAGSAIGDSDTVTVRVYTGTAATGTAIQTLTATRGAGAAYGVDATALTPGGTYTARASQPDTAGNTGQSGTTTFTIDTTAPAVTLTSPATGSSAANPTPSFAGIASSGTGDSASVTVRIYSGGTATGTPVQTLSATRGGGNAYSVASAALDLGTYTARTEQTDTAGNSGLSSANTFTITPAASDPVLIGAGDIAGCGSSEGGPATAALVEQHPDATVFTLGDNAYPNGQPSQYTNCYGASWGAFKSRTRPLTGGHDTETVSGGTAPNQAFTDYFSAQLAPYGSTATDRLKSYYSYDIGTWHVVMLNSSCYTDLPGCNSAQMEQWFRDDLAANDEACTAVMWHDSRWSSGNIHGNQQFVQPLWQIAYEGGADVVLGGNEHDYERFAPQDANGALDNQYGVRAFVVGTGGYYLYDLGTRKPNSEAFSSTYGVMKLTLHPTSYDWQFLPVAGETFTDSGTGNCHGKPSGPSGTPTVRSQSSAGAPYPSTSLTITKPAGTAAGDVLVSTIAHQGGSQRGITPPAGWVNIPGANASDGSNSRIHGFYKVATGAEPASYAFTLSGGSGMSISGGIAAIQGADTANPVNAAGAADTGGANVVLLTAPSITTTKPNTALVYSGAVNTSATFTAPQLMPEQWDIIGGGSYQVANSTAIGGVASAGPTGTRTATLSTSARGVASAIAIAGP